MTDTIIQPRQPGNPSLERKQKQERARREGLHIHDRRLLKAELAVHIGQPHQADDGRVRQTVTPLARRAKWSHAELINTHDELHKGYMR